MGVHRSNEVMRRDCDFCAFCDNDCLTQSAPGIKLGLVSEGQSHSSGHCEEGWWHDVAPNWRERVWRICDTYRKAVTESASFGELQHLHRHIDVCTWFRLDIHFLLVGGTPFQHELLKPRAALFLPHCCSLPLMTQLRQKWSVNTKAFARVPSCVCRSLSVFKNLDIEWHRKS